MVVDPTGDCLYNAIRVVRSDTRYRGGGFGGGRDADTGLRISTTITPRASTQLRAPERPEGPKEEEHEVR